MRRKPDTPQRAAWRARNKEYYKKNKEKIIAAGKYNRKDHEGFSHTYKIRLLWRLRKKCEERCLEFDLTEEDIQIPTHCPALGIPLKFGHGRGPKDDSPSVDRIVPFLGFVRGNIVIVSHKANRIKSDSSLSELQQVAAFYTKLKPENTK